MIKAIVTDIEGTTSSISFVHDVLFPYAAKNLAAYLEQHAQEKEVIAILQQVREIANAPTADLPQLITILLNWIKEDQKITPLKALQGHIWQQGFQQGAFKGHLYEDAYRHLKQWKNEGFKIYIYSSGSEQAQRLLFKYSDFGDLSALIDGYFDTRIGGKKESASYQKISANIGYPPHEILFLSDITAELDAAQQVGIKTICLARDENTTTHHPHITVKDFSGITP